MHRRTAFSLAACLAGAAGLAAQEPELSPAAFELVPPPAVKPASCTTCAPSTVATTAAPVVMTTPLAGGCETRGGALFGSVDYLLFNFRDSPSPPLVQTLPASQFNNGDINADDASTIFGNGIDQNGTSGVRIFGGAWLNDSIAIEGSYSGFETKVKRFYIESQGDPPIGRYFYDVTNNDRPNTYVIYSRPDGSESGFINVESPLRVWTFDVNARGRGTTVFSEHFDWIAGFRYFDLREGIFVQDYIQFNTGDNAGTSLFGEDRFYVTNQFYGAQIGGNSFFELGGGFTLDVTAKIALGGVRQRAQINGVTIERQNGAVTRVVEGDILTQPSNIGEYSRGQFAAMPEVLIKLGYRLGARTNVTIGYNFIGLSNIVRAGSVIDSNVNPNQSPYLESNNNSTAARPAFGFNGTEFWGQGLTLGVSVVY